MVQDFLITHISFEETSADFFSQPIRLSFSEEFSPKRTPLTTSWGCSRLAKKLKTMPIYQKANTQDINKKINKKINKDIKKEINPMQNQENRSQEDISQEDISIESYF